MKTGLKNIEIDELITQSIDPHFSENKDYYSPILRLKPVKNAELVAEDIINLVIHNEILF